MSSSQDVLQELGAERLRDGRWRVDARQLQLTSLFGGPLQGETLFALRGAALSFTRPLELAALPPLPLQ